MMASRVYLYDIEISSRKGKSSLFYEIFFTFNLILDMKLVKYDAWIDCLKKQVTFLWTVRFTYLRELEIFSHSWFQPWKHNRLWDCIVFLSSACTTGNLLITGSFCQQFTCKHRRFWIKLAAFWKLSHRRKKRRWKPLLAVFFRRFISPKAFWRPTLQVITAVVTDGFPVVKPLIQIPSFGCQETYRRSLPTAFPAVVAAGKSPNNHQTESVKYRWVKEIFGGVNQPSGIVVFGG